MQTDPQPTEYSSLRIACQYPFRRTLRSVLAAKTLIDIGFGHKLLLIMDGPTNNHLDVE